MSQLQDSKIQKKTSLIKKENQFIKQFRASVNQNNDGEILRNKFYSEERQNFISITCRIGDLKERSKINYQNNQNQQRKLAQIVQPTFRKSNQNSISKKIYQQFLDDKRKELIQLLCCSFGLLTMLVLIFHQNQLETKSLF